MCGLKQNPIIWEAFQSELRATVSIGIYGMEDDGIRMSELEVREQKRTRIVQVLQGADAEAPE